jgi:thiol-disulfide isomerase/thioredoxin
MMNLSLKKNWSNIVLLIIILVVLIPQTRMPVQVFLQRIISVSPSIIAEEQRERITNFSWELTNLNGDHVNFYEAEGKVVFVNIWATWCPPCIAELPSLQKLYDSYGQDVSFYFVTREDPDVVHAFLQKKGFSLPVFIEKQNAPKLLETQTLPTSYLISKQGEIIIKKVGVANWNHENVRKIIDELLVSSH